MQPPADSRQSQAGFPWIPVLLIGGGILLVGLVAAGFFVWYLLQEPEGIQVEVTTSDPIFASQPFELNVTIMNTSKSTQRIESIDFEDSFLQDVQVLSSDPAWKRVEPVPLLGKSYLYRKTLAPGEKVNIQFMLSTERTGWFHTTLAVYVGIGFQATLHDVSFPVESAK